MSDPLNDPRFPGRPNHPDFWRLSSAVLKLDGQSTDKEFPEIMAPLVDVASLTYMATNRVSRFPVHPAAVWMDGFAAGVVFQQEGGHR